jgi:large subunit ribosomal protein L21
MTLDRIEPKGCSVKGTNRAGDRARRRFDLAMADSVSLDVGAYRATNPCARRQQRRAPASPTRESEPAVYAIVRSGGIQQKVSVGDVIDIDRIDGETGSSVSLPAVLLVDGEKVTSSPDKLAKVAVTAEILGATKGPKIKIQHFKNKSGYRRRLGHRQKYTQVKVTDIKAK